MGKFVFRVCPVPGGNLPRYDGSRHRDAGTTENGGWIGGEVLKHGFSSPYIQSMRFPHTRGGGPSNQRLKSLLRVTYTAVAVAGVALGWNQSYPINHNNLVSLACDLFPLPICWVPP